MTSVDLAIHVDHVSALAAPIRGQGLWGAYWASWRTLWPWPDSPWRHARPGASGGMMTRRRGRTPLLTGEGRTSRSRPRWRNGRPRYVPPAGTGWGLATPRGIRRDVLD